MSVIQEFGKLRQKDFKCQVSLNYVVGQDKTTQAAEHSTPGRRAHRPVLLAQHLTSLSKGSLGTCPSSQYFKNRSVSEKATKEIVLQWNVGSL